MPRKSVSWVVAKATFHITHNGIPVVIREGEFYRSDDPVVKRTPGSFVDADVWVAARSGNERIEQATAAPGEKRNAEIPETK